MAANPHVLSFEDYLRRERKAEFKSEYLDGEVRARAGVTRRHDVLVRRISDFFATRSKQDCGCEKFSADMKVFVAAARKCFYPDLSLACDPPAFFDATEDVLLNPTLIVEVLSKGTASFDLGDKSCLYRQIPSLRHLLLIHQDRQKIGHWYRSDEGWEFEEHEQGGIPLPELNEVLPLEAIYTEG
jgi:Uma2 family endonuclease